MNGNVNEEWIQWGGVHCAEGNWWCIGVAKRGTLFRQVALEVQCVTVRAAKWW